MQRKFIMGLLLASTIYAGCKRANEPNPDVKYKTLNGLKPIVIGHRGAPGYQPEHTLASYSLGIQSGADFIEPDLVVTKDGFLICRHEPMLSGTTNVSELPEFANKKSTKMVDGEKFEDWFASDFTLAEIKKLKAKQSMASRPKEFDNKYDIPTFEEVIGLVKAHNEKTGKTVGVYPETKHPTFHEKLGLPITDKLLSALIKANWNDKNSPVFVQSFEVSNLMYLRKKSSVKIVQLYDAYDVDKSGKLTMEAPNGQPFDFVESGDPRTYNDLTKNEGLEFVKQYADGIGPWKPFIQPYTFTDTNNDGKADDINGDGSVNTADFSLLPATDLIERAHKKGLFVHAYTFRNESSRLLSDYKNDPKAEYKHFYKLGVDGVFSDFPETAVMANE